MSEETGPEKPKGKPVVKWIIWGLLAIGLFVGFKFLPIDEWWKVVSDWIESLGIWGPIAFIAIYAIATVFLIPGSALTLGAGLLFGVVWGSVWVIIAANLGANLAFLIGRYFARDAVSKKIEGNEKFKAIDEAVGDDGWKIVGLTRLSPVFPFTLLNYAFGLTKVSWFHYMIASLIGMIPGTVMYVYFGSLGKLAAESGESSTAKIILYIVGGLATVLVTVLVTRSAKKALNKKTDLSEE